MRSSVARDKVAVAHADLTVAQITNSNLRTRPGGIHPSNNPQSNNSV